MASGVLGWRAGRRSVWYKARCGTSVVPPKSLRNDVVKKITFGLVARSRRQRILNSGIEPEQMLERYTASALDAVEKARQKAGGQEAQPEHLLWGLLAVQAGLAAGVARSFGLGLESVASVLEASEVGETNLCAVSPTESDCWSERSQKAFSFALRAALLNHCQLIGDDHLLLGVVAESEDSKGALSELLVEIGADYHRVEERIRRMHTRPREEPVIQS